VSKFRRLIGIVCIAFPICLVPIAQSFSDDTLEQTVRGIVQQELARQLATRPTNITRPSLQSDIIEQLRRLTETINQFGSRLESVEAAVNLRPSSPANAPASFANAELPYTDLAANYVSEEQKICTTGPSSHAVGDWAVVEGDIVIGPANQSDYRYFAPGLSDRRWRQGIVPYEIDNTITSDQRAEIFKAINEWQKATTGLLYFRYRRTPQDKNYISFTKMPPGPGAQACGDSPVGMVGNGRQLIRLNLPRPTGCGTIQRTTMHEIGHAIGLFHEHTRDDRDQYVRIIWKNIASEPKQFCRVMYNLYRGAPPGEDLTKTYDFTSIMHYGVRSSAKSCPPGQLPATCWTIVPLPGKLIGFGITAEQIGTLPIISGEDLKAVERLYGQREPPPQPPEPPPNTVWCCSGPPPASPPHGKIVCCCCCWRYRSTDCWRPQAWGRGFWRPPSYRYSTYFDDWDQ
jgi:hypothetical protein